MRKDRMWKKTLVGILGASLILGSMLGGAVYAEEEFFDTEEELLEDAAGDGIDISEYLEEEEPALEADEGEDISLIEDEEEKAWEVTEELDLNNITSQMGSATVISAGQEVSVNPSVPRFYKFTAPSNGCYLITSTAPRDDDDEIIGDPFIRVFDSAGNFLGDDDDSGPSLDFEYKLWAQQGKTFYIMAYVYSETETYKMKITSESGNSDAIILVAGTPVQPPYYSYEYYVFTADVKGVYDFNLVSTNECEDIDLYLTNYNAGYERSNCDEDSTYAADTLSLEQGEKIFVKVYADPYDGEGTLTLTVSLYTTYEDDQIGYNDYRYSGFNSGAVEDVAELWQSSPLYQTTDANVPVKLQVGWSVPGNTAPKFTWTVNSEVQSEKSDTFTFKKSEPGEYDIHASMDDYDLSVSFGVEVNAHTHTYGAWTTKPATALAAGSMTRKCTVCGQPDTKTIPKLTPFITLNVGDKLPMKTKQKTNKVKVSFQTGDYVTSWTSSNEKAVTVDKNGLLKAGKKKGTSVITVKLASGLSKSFTVQVKPAKVKASKITVTQTQATLKKGQKLDLAPVVEPITCTDKLTYTTSNKKVATVKKGVITARKKGKATITVKCGRKKVKVKVVVTE